MLSSAILIHCTDGLLSIRKTSGKTIWWYCDVRTSDTGAQIVENIDRMPGASWFADARLNFTENLLRRSDDTPAIISRGEGKPDRIITYAQLNQQVNRLVRAYQAAGIEAGDRIVAYMPNIPETVICMLAAASCGATWSSCSPDFGAQGVIDRFGQIAPQTADLGRRLHVWGQAIRHHRKVGPDRSESAIVGKHPCLYPI